MVGSYTDTLVQTKTQDITVSVNKGTGGNSSADKNEELPLRLRELQQKILDESYLDYAIDRIAVVMSRHIVDAKSITGNSVEYI